MFQRIISHTTWSRAIQSVLLYNENQNIESLCRTVCLIYVLLILFTCLFINQGYSVKQYYVTDCTTLFK